MASINSTETAGNLVTASKNKTEDQKNAERIQDFINKFKITAKDLDNTDSRKAEKNKQDKHDTYNWQGYQWFQEATNTLEDRGIKTLEYREMCRTPEINQSLNIYSDNSTQYDVEKNVLEIQSNNSKIIEVLNQLFFETLDANGNLWHYVRNMCKLGDEYLEVAVDNEKNPKHIISLERFKSPENMERIEEDGNLVKFKYTTNPNESNERAKEFQPWQIIHLRIEDEETDPYGKSVLEAGRKIWKKLSLMEDAMIIYRISRAPERRVFYIDVGNLSTKDANNYIEQIKTKFKKKTYINATTGEIDQKANPLCITLDTKIDLLDGRSETLSTLIEEYSSGKENWVYSIDRENGNAIVPGKIVWAGETRKSATLVEVVLDNGEKLRTTPDHKFMLRDGSYCEAKDLASGKSLMPLYKKLSTKEDGLKIEGYTMAYNPKKEKYVFMHRVVGDTVLREERENTRKSIDWNKNNNLVLHHKNLNSEDCSPENLVWMGNEDHFIHHASSGREVLIRYNLSEKHSDDVRKSNIERNSVAAMSWYNGSDLHKEHNKIRSASLSAQFANLETRQKYIDGMTTKISQNFWTRLKEVAQQTELNSQGYVSAENVIQNALQDQEIISIWNRSARPQQKDKFNWTILERFLKKMGFNSTQDWLYRECNVPTKNHKAVYQNHKVVSVNILSYVEDTGCITVEKYHNFATSAGVFVKNSVDEDFYIGVRSNSQGTRIETLPGGCLTLDTKIPSLDGNSYSLSEMIQKYESGEEQWIYSCDPITGEFAPGLVSWAGITHKSAKIMELELDNGEKISCTPDHKFPVWGRNFVEAKDLVLNDSIISHQTDKNGFLPEYERVYDHHKKTWLYTHRVVAQKMKNTDMYQSHIFESANKLTTVHHKDFNKHNNSPSNLVWMDPKDHWNYHSRGLDSHEHRKELMTRCRKIYHERLKTDPEFKKSVHDKKSKTMIDYCTSFSEEKKNEWAQNSIRARTVASKKFNDKMLSDLEFRSKVLEKRSISISNAFTEERKQKLVELNKEWIKRPDHYQKVYGNTIAKFDDHLLTLFIDCLKQNKNFTKTIEWINSNPENEFTKYFKKLNEHNTGVFNPEKLSGKFSRNFVSHYGYKNVKDFSEKVSLRNHRVVGIKYLDYVEDVGTLTIDQHEIYHNYHTFALDCGIYTKNSNTGEIGDVQYFKTQLLSTLGIPAAYLGVVDAGGGGAQYDGKSYLSNQEMQFSRTIERIQKLVVKGLEKIAILELVFNDFDEDELKNFKIIMTPPSSVEQLMDLEVRSQQFGLIQSIKGIENFLPDDWIYKKVLGFSDEEVIKIKLQLQMQMQQQAQMAAALAAIGGGDADAGGGGMSGGGMGGGGDIMGGQIGGAMAPGEAGGGGEGPGEGAPEVGGPEPEAAPPAEGGGPSLDVSSNQVEFDGTKWLVENTQDMKKLLEYIKLYEKVNSNKRNTFTQNNMLTRMTIKGEFRGLLEVCAVARKKKILKE